MQDVGGGGVACENFHRLRVLFKFMLNFYPPYHSLQVYTRLSHGYTILWTIATFFMRQRAAEALECCQVYRSALYTVPNHTIRMKTVAAITSARQNCKHMLRRQLGSHLLS
jgi:hypothetical protein